MRINRFIVVVFPFHRMLKLEHDEVQFHGSLAALNRQVVRQQFRRQLSATLQQRLLFRFVVLVLRDFGNHLSEFTQFGIRLYNGDGGFLRFRSFQDCG